MYEDYEGQHKGLEGGPWPPTFGQHVTGMYLINYIQFAKLAPYDE